MITSWDTRRANLRRAGDSVGGLSIRPEVVTSVWSLQRQRAPPWAPFAAVRLGPPRYFLRLTRSQFLATRSRLSAVTLSLPEPQLMRSRVAVAGGDGVVAGAARDHVAARAAADLVLAALAAQCVVAAAAGQECPCRSRR